MFLSVINPNPVVRFNGKLRNLQDKVEKTYLAMGELIDRRDKFYDEACKAYVEFQKGKQQFAQVVEILKPHAGVHSVMYDCDAFAQAEKDFQTDKIVAYAVWCMSASRIHQAELQMIALSQEVAHELDKLLIIRDDASYLFGRVCGEGSLDTLNDIIQAGELLTQKHSHEVQHSKEFAGVR